MAVSYKPIKELVVDFYPWDRIEVPSIFYTPKKLICNLTAYPPGEGVLTASGPYNQGGYLELNPVTRQTPFGQGLVPGYKFKKDVMRPATKEEILAALDRDHDEGPDYRPPNPNMWRRDYNKLLEQWVEMTAKQADLIRQSLR